MYRDVKYRRHWANVCSPQTSLFHTKMGGTLRAKGLDKASLFYARGIIIVTTKKVQKILSLWLNSTDIIHVFVGTHGGSISFLCSVLFRSHLLSLPSPQHHTSPPPCSLPLHLYLSHYLLLLLSLSLSCLFHRALQHLRINKLYISLCTHFKAPFRKGTKLICPWASVYPKWLHQTWSWEPGSPDCPCLFVMYQT